MSKEKENLPATVDYEAKAVASLGLSKELAAFKMKEGEEWGAGANIQENKELFVNDFLIPKLWLIQSMSQLRIDDLAKEGDYANSISGKVLTNGEDKLNFIVVNSYKYWQTFKINEKQKKEFVESERMTLKNANYEYNFKEDGIEHTRRQVLSFTILLAGDLNNGITRPYVLDFAGSSKRAGRILVTEINEAYDAKYPAAVFLFSLTSKQEKNEDGTFFTKQVVKTGTTNAVIVGKAREVYDNLIKHEDQIEVDQSDLVNTTAKEVPAKEIASDEV